MDQRLDKLFRALSDPARRRMLDLMRERPRTTGELVSAFPDLTRYAVMRHIQQLDEAGLITIRREGRTRWNVLNALPLREMYERWVSRFEGAWSASILDLRRLAEQDKPAPDEPTPGPAQRSAGPGDTPRARARGGPARGGGARPGGRAKKTRRKPS